MLVARAGQDRLDFGASDHLAHRTLGHRLHGAFGILDVEEIVADAVGLDPPQHGEIDVDDVLVAGQHQALFRHVAHRAAAPRRSSSRRMPMLSGVDAQRLRQQHGLDRIRQMIVQAGLHGADMLAEAQHDAEFFRLHAEEARQRPDHDRAGDHEDDAGGAEIAARQECCRRSWPRRIRSSRSGGPARPTADREPHGPCGPRAPWAAALILPWHRLSPFCADL